MKLINNYLTEKLHLNKDIGLEENFQFDSHVTNNPIEIKMNYIVGSYDWKPSRIAILIEYAKDCLNLLEDPKDIEFVKDWLYKAKDAYKHNNKSYIGGGNSRGKDFAWLCNGEKYTFGNAKFTYDLLQYALTKPNLTIPRRQKIEKILRDNYNTVEKHKDEMNWY